MTYVYQTLQSIAYPIFKPKLESVTGVELLPASGGYILAANHVDWLDGFYIAAAVGIARNHQVNFLTSSNNYWWTTAAIQIPKEKSKIIDHAVEELQSGKILCNFPEGQRNPDATLLEGKTGTVRMAALAGVPIVPVGIRCDSGKNMAQSMMYLMSRNHKVAISIGQSFTPQIPPGGITKEWLASQTAILMNTIAPLANKKG